MIKRKDVINRFNQSSINIFDLTVVPSENVTYQFNPRPKSELKNY